MRILLAAITCAKGDLDANLATNLAVLADASLAGADLVVFPEMSLTGSVDPTRHRERAERWRGADRRARKRGGRAGQRHRLW